MAIGVQTDMATPALARFEIVSMVFLDVGFAMRSFRKISASDF